jgi:hypothetical protein
MCLVWCSKRWKALSQRGHLYGRGRSCLSSVAEALLLGVFVAGADVTTCGTVGLATAAIVELVAEDACVWGEVVVESGVERMGGSEEEGGLRMEVKCAADEERCIRTGTADSVVSHKVVAYRGGSDRELSPPEVDESKEPRAVRRQAGETEAIDLGKLGGGFDREDWRIIEPGRLDWTVEGGRMAGPRGAR